MTKSIDEQLAGAARRFEARFGRRPGFAAVAPGRVNLIGEHTDYNDGYVLPMAIQRQTLIVADRAAAGTGARATVVSTHEPREAVFEVGPAMTKGEPGWSNYVRGAVHGCVRRGLEVGGFDAVIDSTVPLGGGLSSSAALEVATATLMEAMAGKTLDPVDKALLSQEAEHTFAGVPCGIMDQFIATMAREDHALLLDCRSHETRMVPMRDSRVTVLIVNSNVRHELTGGEYAQRRAQCEAAAKALGARALRDVSMPELLAAKERLEPLAFRRAFHVVGEIARTRQAADEAQAGVWASFGRLMFKSHESLRDHFEVSCAELDILVELARKKCSQEGGVLGARMTGGGFGGCTVTLVRTDAADAVSRHIAEGYKKKTGIEATAFATRAAGGARVVGV